MKSRVLALTVLSLLSAHAAQAGYNSVYFDTIDGNLGGSFDSYQDLNWGSSFASVIAQSFSAASPDFNSINLTLSADNPSDGGSVSVYLVADDGSGGGAGIAGNPLGFTGITPTIDTTGALLLGTVKDSALPSTETVLNSDGGGGTYAADVKFTLNTSAIPTTSNDEYWVVAVGTVDGTFGWFSALNGTQSTEVTGTGITNQLSANNGGDGWGTFDPGLYDTGSYSLDVSNTNSPPPAGVPEPATMALLGVGLAGLGFSRRRRAA